MFILITGRHHRNGQKTRSNSSSISDSMILTTDMEQLIENLVHNHTGQLQKRTICPCGGRFTNFTYVKAENHPHGKIDYYFSWVSDTK